MLLSAGMFEWISRLKRINLREILISHLIIVLMKRFVHNFLSLFNFFFLTKKNKNRLNFVTAIFVFRKFRYFLLHRIGFVASDQRTATAESRIAHQHSIAH